MAYDDKPEPAPDRGPRKGEGKMKDDEFQSLVQSLVKEAQSHQQALEADAEKATDFFKGKALGNEKDGRSKVVITEVRDKTLGVLPDILAMFFGQDRTIEYIPTSAQKVDAVEQISDFVSKAVIETDNNGFMAYHAVLLDGLIRRIGAFKWGWEPTPPKQISQSGLTREQVELLLSEDGVELIEDGMEESDDKGPDGQPLYDIEYQHDDKDGKAWMGAIPPEELIFLPSTRDPQSALFIGHILEKTKGELIALGYSEKEIDKHGAATNDSMLETDPIRLARQVENASSTDGVTAGEANKKILYVEGYAHIDYDGDGIAELRKICTIGVGHYPVMNKPVDEVPISVFCPIPEPHTMVGQSYADLTMDIQRIKSGITRGILDSLSIAIFPRTWFKENDANITDVMATDTGAPIRTRTGAGAVGTFQHTFVGKDAFPLLSYFDEVSEKRTGSPGAQGLDMDALQSTEKAAAGAAIQANRSHNELVARIFAEMALKPMYRGLYKLIVKHQPRKRMVRLRERWIEVDPRTWDSDLDVQVNVALGGAPKEYKLATLAGFKATQEAILQQLGPDNPIVGLGNYRYTLGKMSELSGFPDSTKFFKPIPLDWTPPPPPPGSQPPPDPNMALVQVEAQKVQMQMQLKQQELQMRMQEMAAQHEARMQEIMARHSNDSMKAQIDLAIRERQLAIQEFAVSSKAGVDAQKANAEVELMQAEADLMVRKHTHEAHLSTAETAHKVHMDERKQDHTESQPAGGSQ